MAGPRGPLAGIGFPTLHDALQYSTELRSILERSKCSPATLLRHMRRAQPNLVQRAQRFRPPLSKKNRALRLELARRNLRLLHDKPTYWRRVIWVDAKKLWVKPKGGLVWTDRRRPLPPLPFPGFSSSGKSVLLHYYAAVNADLGPIGMVFVTGTPGQTRKYKASVVWWGGGGRLGYCWYGQATWQVLSPPPLHPAAFPGRSCD
jgi:hypothetical protein